MEQLKLTDDARCRKSFAYLSKSMPNHILNLITKELMNGSAAKILMTTGARVPKQRVVKTRRDVTQS